MHLEQLLMHQSVPHRLDLILSLRRGVDSSSCGHVNPSTSSSLSLHSIYQSMPVLSDRTKSISFWAKRIKFSLSTHTEGRERDWCYYIVFLIKNLLFIFFSSFIASIRQRGFAHFLLIRLPLLGLKEVDTGRFFLARLFVSVLSRHAYLPIKVLVCH